MSSTYYTATSRIAVAADPLDGSARADLCIIGGGFTGLSAALHATRRGLRTVLLERGGLGDGASGRNGGQAHIGMRREQPWLEAHLGIEPARALWRLSQDARAALLQLIEEERIECDWRPGLLHLDHKPGLVAESRATVTFMRERYGHEALRFVDRDEARALVNSAGYHGGMFDASGGHLHPLDLALGLARAAQRAGAVLHPGTPATRVERVADGFVVHTARGEVRAERVLLALNGYFDGLDRTAAAHVAPLNNYIAVTEPLSARAAELIRDQIAVSDSRVVVYYFRRTSDDRLLFGGGEGNASSSPVDVAALVRPHLLRVFPQLRDVRLEHAWGGTLAITPNRMPYVRVLQPGLVAVGGYCGMGVILAPYVGRLVAEALTGSSTDFDRLAGLRVPRFPGGARLRRPLLSAVLTLLALKDRL